MSQYSKNHNYESLRDSRIHEGDNIDINGLRKRQNSQLRQLTSSSGDQPDYCSRGVERLKAGPANIPELICKNQKYADEEFRGSDMIFWPSYNTYGSYAGY